MDQTKENVDALLALGHSKHWGDAGENMDRSDRIAWNCFLDYIVAMWKCLPYIHIPHTISRQATLCKVQEWKGSQYKGMRLKKRRRREIQFNQIYANRCNAIHYTPLELSALQFTTCKYQLLYFPLFFNILTLFYLRVSSMLSNYAFSGQIRSTFTNLFCNLILIHSSYMNSRLQ